MFRAIFELLITLIVVMVARSLLTGLFKGISNATAQSFQQVKQPEARKEPRGNDLHRDPVCGTFVTETTGYRRHISGQMFYYCSEACREKHSLVAR